MTEKRPVKNWSDVTELSSTGDIRLPSDPLDRVLGQNGAIEMAKIAAKQEKPAPGRASRHRQVDDSSSAVVEPAGAET